MKSKMVTAKENWERIKKVIEPFKISPNISARSTRKNKKSK